MKTISALPEITSYEVTTSQETTVIPVSEFLKYPSTYILTEDGVTRYLVPEADDQAEDTTSIDTVGPATLHMWNAFMGKTDCFIQKNSLVPQLKKKIVFCNAYSARFHLYSFLSVFRQFCQYWDCFIWKGEQTDLRAEKPLTALELVCSLHEMQPATAKQILAHFKEQQIDPGQWLIMDEYTGQTYSNGTEMLLLPLFEEKEKQSLFLQCIDPTQVIKLNVYLKNETDLVKFSELLPDLLRLQVLKLACDVSLFSQCIKLLKNTSIEQLICYIRNASKSKTPFPVDFSPLKSLKEVWIQSTARIALASDHLIHVYFILRQADSLICVSSESSKNIQINSQRRKEPSFSSQDSKGLVEVFKKTHLVPAKDSSEESVDLKPFSEKAHILSLNCYLQDFGQDTTLDFREFKNLKNLNIYTTKSIEEEDSLEKKPTLLVILLPSSLETFEYNAAYKMHTLELQGTLPNLLNLHIIGDEYAVFNLKTGYLRSLKKIYIHDNFSIHTDISKDFPPWCEIECFSLATRLTSDGTVYPPPRSVIATESTRPRSAIRGHSFYSAGQDKLEIAARMGDQTTRTLPQADDTCSVSLTSIDKQQSVDIRDYRINIFDDVGFDAKIGEVQFSAYKPEPDEKAYTPITKSLSDRKPPSKHSLHTGLFAAKLKYGRVYSLPVTAPVALYDFFDIYAETDPAGVQVGIYQDPDLQHYFVRLLKFPDGSIPLTCNVKLRYDFQPARNYTQQSFGELALTRKSFPSELREKLDKALKGDSELRFLFDESASRSQKMADLSRFCDNFKPDTRLSRKGHNGLETLLICIAERKGNCRERAQILMLLGYCYIGLEVRLITNEIHAYAEVLMQDGSARQIELGGGTLSPESKELQEARSKLKSISEQPLPPKVIEHKRISSPPDCSFISFFKRHLEKRTPFSLTLLAQKTSSATQKPWLLELEDGVSIADIRKDYFKPNDDFLYIDSPKDFHYYGQSYGIDKAGKRVPIPGRLQLLLESGGTLLLNLSEFSLQECFYYRSLWSASPTLNGDPVKGSLCIVGLWSKTRPCPDVLVNSFEICFLPQRNQEQKAKPSLQEIKIEKEIDSIDLYKNAKWYSRLVAGIKFTSSGFKMTEGPLLVAIRNNSPLVIHRPPVSDPDFQRLLEQIQIEKRFLFNGEWVLVPEGFEIILRETAAKKLETSARASLLTILTDDEKMDSKNRYYLNRDNWESLFEQVRIDESSGLAETKPGLLHEYQDKPDQIVFFLTEQVSSVEWDCLEDFIETGCKGSSYSFVLAYKTSLEKLPTFSRTVAGETIPVASIDSILPSALTVSETSVAYLSEDPAYLTQKLQTLYHSQEIGLRVIDLTPNIGVSDLLVSMTLRKQREEDLEESQTGLYFNLEKKALLTELEAGRTVILKGEIPIKLMQALLPVFSKQPHVMFNEKQIPVTGRLILVQPPHIKRSPLLSYTQCDFRSQDYRDGLLALYPVAAETKTESETESETKTEPSIKTLQSEAKASITRINVQEIVDQLLLLAELVKFPHRGPGMPKAGRLTWVRLRQMYVLLFNLSVTVDGDPDNPLKGLCSSDYVPGSNESAYIDVSCKFLFSTQLEARIDIEEFARLERIFNTSERASESFAWQFLNTCNGPMLKQLLGKDWLRSCQAKTATDGPLINIWTSLLWTPVFEKLRACYHRERPKPLSASASATTDLKSALVSLDLPDLPPRSVDDPIEHLDRLLKNARTRVIAAKGMPGVGKTHYLHQLRKLYSCFYGMSEFGDWLKSSTKADDELCLLLLDEPNMASPGMLDKLDSIHRTPAEILYEDQWYPLPPQKKIVAAMNSEYFEGRNYHDILTQGAEVVWVTLPEPSKMIEWLTKIRGMDPKSAGQLLNMAEVFKTLHPLVGYSFRDLEDVALRFQLLSQDKTTEIPAKHLFSAIWIGFGIRLRAEQQAVFKTRLVKELDLKPHIDDNSTGFMLVGQYFPPEMRDARAVLQQSLLMRQHVITSGQSIAYKRMVLISGSPKVGKWSLCEHLFKEMKLSPSSLAARDIGGQNYIVIDTPPPASMAKSFELQTKFKMMFDQGLLGIIKNFHYMDADGQAYLNTLLTGVDEKGRESKNPGFFIIALQTDSGSIPPALQNRMQSVQIEDYSTNSWQMLAQAPKVLPPPRADAYGSSFTELRKTAPYITGDVFFDGLSELKKKQVIISKFLKNVICYQPPTETQNQSGDFNFYQWNRVRKTNCLQFVVSFGMASMRMPTGVERIREVLNRSAYHELIDHASIELITKIAQGRLRLNRSTAHQTKELYHLIVNSDWLTSDQLNQQCQKFEKDYGFRQRCIEDTSCEKSRVK